MLNFWYDKAQQNGMVFNLNYAVLSLTFKKVVIYTKSVDRKALTDYKIYFRLCISFEQQSK